MYSDYISEQKSQEKKQKEKEEILKKIPEAIYCIKALEKGIVPPTINYKEKDEECDLDIVPNEPRKADLKIVMSNSLGFGGHNACIVMKKFS